MSYSIYYSQRNKILKFLSNISQARGIQAKNVKKKYISKESGYKKISILETKTPQKSFQVLAERTSRDPNKNNSGNGSTRQ